MAEAGGGGDGRFVMPELNDATLQYLAHGDEHGNGADYYLNQASEVIERCWEFHKSRAVRDSLDWIIYTTKAIIQYLEAIPEHERINVFSKYSNKHITFRGVLPITIYKFRQWEMITRAEVLHERIRRDGMSIKEIEEALGHRTTAIRGRNSEDGRRRVSSQKVKIDALETKLQVSQS